MGQWVMGDGWDLKNPLPLEWGWTETVWAPLGLRNTELYSPTVLIKTFVFKHHSYCDAFGIHQCFLIWHLLQNLRTLKHTQTLITDWSLIIVTSSSTLNGTIRWNLIFLRKTLVSEAHCLPPKFKPDIYISLAEHTTCAHTLMVSHICIWSYKKFS